MLLRLVVSVYRHLPPDGTLNRGVLVVVLWRQWFVFFRHNFAGAPHAAVNCRIGCGSARRMNLVKFVARASYDVVCVFVDGHRSPDCQKRVQSWPPEVGTIVRRVAPRCSPVGSIRMVSQTQRIGPSLSRLSRW